LQDKAEDAGGLTPVKDDNEVMRFPDCRTFLSIFGNCSKYAGFSMPGFKQKNASRAFGVGRVYLHAHTVF